MDHVGAPAGPTLLLRTAAAYDPGLHMPGIAMVVDAEDLEVRRSWARQGLATCWYPPPVRLTARDLPGAYLEIARRLAWQEREGRAPMVAVGPDGRVPEPDDPTGLLAALLVPEVRRIEIGRFPEAWRSDGPGKRALQRLLGRIYELHRAGWSRGEADAPGRVLLLESPEGQAELDPVGRMLLEAGIRPAFGWSAGDLDPGEPAPELVVVDLSRRHPSSLLDELRRRLPEGASLVCFGARDLPPPAGGTPPRREVLAQWPVHPEIRRETLREILIMTPWEERLALVRPLVTRRGDLEVCWVPPGGEALTRPGRWSDILDRSGKILTAPRIQPDGLALLTRVASPEDLPPAGPVYRSSCHLECLPAEGEGWRLVARGPLGSKARIRMLMARAPRSISAMPDQGRGFFYDWDGEAEVLTLRFQNAPDALEIQVR